MKPERRLATILFTDIVGSTGRAAELGDERWRELLETHHALARAVLRRFRGREVNTTGDGFLATFDVPERAIRCACALRGYAAAGRGDASAAIRDLEDALHWVPGPCPAAACVLHVPCATDSAGSSWTRETWTGRSGIC